MSSPTPGPSQTRQVEIEGQSQVWKYDNEKEDENLGAGGEAEGGTSQGGDGAEDDEEEGMANGEQKLSVEQETGDDQPPLKRRERKEPTTLERESGKSLLPFSRVQKIIKADKVRNL